MKRFWCWWTMRHDPIWHERLGCWYCYGCGSKQYD